MKKLLLALLLCLCCAFSCMAEDPIETVAGGKHYTGWHVWTSAAVINAAPELVTSYNTWAQTTQPATIEVTSAVGIDTTGTVTIYGILHSSGNLYSESVALTADQATTSTATFRYVDQVKLSYPTSGAVTVRKSTGDKTITAIPITRLDSPVAQHFNGQKQTVLQGWAANNIGGGNTLCFQLRWYPDDSRCLNTTYGYITIDEISMPAAIGASEPRIFGRGADGIMLPAGGWLCVFAKGGAASQSGSVTFWGYDRSAR